MVQQTRQVVENYVLYKIHSSLDVEDYSTDGASCVDQESPLRIAKRLPIPQQYSQTDLAVQSIACQYETRYKDIFPDVLEELRNAKISAQDVNHIFSKISKDLFRLPIKQAKTLDQENGNIAIIGDYGAMKSARGDESHIKWGHVIALLVFAGILSVRAVECGSDEIVDHIVLWVTKFFDTELRHWFSAKGGWENFVQWSGSAKNSSRDDFDPDRFTSGIRSLMSIGVLAACVGLGAMMMVKK